MSYGAPTGPCSPRSSSPSLVAPPSPRSNANGSSPARGESPQRGTSPTRQSPTVHSAATPQSTLVRSGQSWKDCTAVQAPLDTWKREARLCVHADTNNNTTVYPNYVFDPDGEIVPTSKAGAFDMAQLIMQQSDGINYAGQATGIMVACTGDPARAPLRFGSFFQVSPTRGVGCFHNTQSPADPRRRLRDVWVSKVCFVNHWEALISVPKCRQKYFRKARIVGGFDEHREPLLARFSDSMKIGGLSPPTPIDFVVLELPPDFSNDPYLKPLPKNKFKTIKKIGVLAYNQKEPRREEARLDVYHNTTGVPLYDQESRFMHFGNKSLSPGILVNSTEQFITYEASLTEGAGGGPLVSLTRPHYFWGVQCCAFYDAEAHQPHRSRNYNVAISFYHPGVMALYERFVLPTLPETEETETRAACYQ